MRLHLERKIADQNDAILYGTMVKCFQRAHRVDILRELATCLAAQATLQTRAPLAALSAEVCKPTEPGHRIAGRLEFRVQHVLRMQPFRLQKNSPYLFWHARSHITSHVA